MIDDDAILLLTPGFPADEADSSCLPPLQSFVEALAERRPAETIDVVAFQYPFMEGSYTWRGVRVHALGGRNRRVNKPRTWLRALRRSPSSDPGIIHSFWLGECTMIGTLLARRSGRRHVVSVGGQEIRRRTTYGRLLRRAPFTLTAGSRHAAEAARLALGRNADAVIPLGLDAHRIPPMNPAAERPIDLLAVGSLIPIKQMHEVVDVVIGLLDRHPDLKVHIAGDGPERDRIRNAVDRAGLEDHVTMHGETPREEVLGLMARSKILLHPSAYESQGYVFLEALASGAYVVCRNVGFLPSDEKVVRCANVEEMAEASGRLLRGPRIHTPIAVPTANETAGAFEAIYEGLM